MVYTMSKYYRNLTKKMAAQRKFEGSNPVFSWMQILPGYSHKLVESQPSLHSVDSVFQRTYSN